jgi:hypothetical protein
MQVAQGISKLLFSLSQPGTCFDLGKFISELGKFTTQTVVGKAGFGLGVYKGIDHLAEYLSLLSPQVTKGFISVTPAPNPEPTMRIQNNGQSVALGINVVNKFLDNKIMKNPTDYLESTISFTGCDTKASLIEFPPKPRIISVLQKKNTGVSTLAEMVFKTMDQDSKNLGVLNICKHHTKFCTGSLAQFRSESECISFYNKLPIESSKCTRASLLSGNTVTCRAKHQFMAAVSPQVHCAHLGKLIINAGVNSAVCNDNLCETPGDRFQIDPISDTMRSIDGKKSFRQLILEADSLALTRPWKFASFC